MSRDHPSDYKKFPCVTPSWDNSARKRVATIIQNEDPTAYAEWLERTVERVQNYSDDEKIVFINAWNEWAEGCYLEPDLKYGKMFLEATRAALGKFYTNRKQ
jgi:lipopolysaccharide biosynthesis protein